MKQTTPPIVPPAASATATPTAPTTPPAPAAPATYGYARVSSRDQNLARQIAALAEHGVPPQNIYADHASGKDFNRPSYLALCNRLAPGDTLVIKSIDRLGRNYSEILEEWRRISKALGAAIVVLDMPLLNTTATADGATAQLISDIVLQLLSYVAQAERENIRQRQAEGIALAKTRGVRFGRPRKPKPPEFRQTLGLYRSGALTRAEAARSLQISASTFDRWIRQEAFDDSQGSA